MTETIKDSLKMFFTILGSILAGLAGIWWGIRAGDAIYYLTGINIRLFLCVLMSAGLLYQAYSTRKNDRSYDSAYRVFLWISGVLICILLYSLLIMVAGDIIVFIIRCVRHIQVSGGPAGTFRLVMSGCHPESSLSEYGRVWGSPVWNYENTALISLPFSIIITVYGLKHARKLTVRFYHITMPGSVGHTPGHTVNKASSSKNSYSEAAGSAADICICSKSLSDVGHTDTPDRKNTAPNSSCRIVHLSDLHMGSIVGSSHIEQATEMTAQLKPDYVLITGDIFNHGFVEECSEEELERIEKAFRKLNEQCAQRAEERKINVKPGKEGFEEAINRSFDSVHVNRSSADSSSSTYGRISAGVNKQHKARQRSSYIFAVLGNHDPLPSDPALQHFLKEAHITLLFDQTEPLPEFDLAGRGGNHVDHRPPISSWLAHSSEGKPVILMDHYPDGIHDAQEAGVDLMLCGHTHEGQYFPCNYLIRKHYSHGLIHGYTKWGKTQNIVSSGTGYFQIPIRVGTDSEIVCIDLTITYQAKRRPYALADGQSWKAL